MTQQSSRKPLRVGTSSWSAKSWEGNFYAPGTRPGDYLANYAQVFDTVEADVTYYRTPSPQMVDGWKRKTPEHFVLSAKMPRNIVHAGQGAAPDSERVLVHEHVERTTQDFLEVMRRLGGRLGPLVLQFPYFNKRAFEEAGPFLERLDQYLSRLPRDLRFAVELRNRNWVSEEFLGILREHQVAFVLLDLVYMPHPAELASKFNVVTADFAYTRLIGDRKKIDGLTDRFDKIVLDQSERLERFVPLLQDVGAEVEDLFVYANNHYAGHGPATAAQIKALVRGEEVPHPPRVPRPGELPF